MQENSCGGDAGDERAESLTHRQGSLCVHPRSVKRGDQGYTVDESSVQLRTSHPRPRALTTTAGCQQDTCGSRHSCNYASEVGARLRPWTSPTKAAGVTIGITADRIRKLAEQCIALTKYGPQVPKQVVRQLAGLASRISTLMPQLSA